MKTLYGEVICASVAAFCGSQLWFAFARGKIWDRYGWVSRQNSRIWFWFGVGLFTFGLLVMAAMIPILLLIRISN